MPNAQIQKYNYKILKYSNTAYDEVLERPNIWHIFEKRIFQGCQKLYSHTIQSWTPEFRTVVRGLVINIICNEKFGTPSRGITLITLLNTTLPCSRRDIIIFKKWGLILIFWNLLYYTFSVWSIDQLVASKWKEISKIED